MRDVKIYRLGKPSPEDLRKLVELEKRVHESSTYYDEAPWGEQNFRKSLPGKDELSSVAAINGRPVGFLIASRPVDGIHVHRLAVDPVAQGAGIASLLLARLLASSSGPVTVICDPLNAGALELYRRAGFRNVESTPAGKSLLATEALKPAADLRVWYVFTSTGMQASHAAHLPRLVEAMSRTSRVTGIKYGDPVDLASIRLTLGWARAFLALLLRARRERVDVIFVRIHWRLAALLWLAGKVGGWRVALWSSGGPGLLPEERSTAKERVSRLMHRFVLRHAVDAVATGPPRVLDDYARRYGLSRDRLLLASNDVKLDQWLELASTQPALAASPDVRKWLESPHRLLYVHGLDRLRGADRLPDLLARLRKSLGEAELLVLGDGPLQDSLEGSGLLLGGRVPNEVAAWAMASAHCLLVPSRQEGFPRVLVEAMALGLPSVTFDVGGCSDVLGAESERYVARDGDLSQMAALATSATRIRSAGGPQSALVERARAFDTDRVATLLIATLRALRTQGPTEASWLSRSLWRQDFPIGRV